MAEGRDRTPILVAILGLAGVLGAAVIANWEKIHSTNNPAETQTPQRATLAPNASFPTSAGGMQQDDRINDLAFDPSENLLASASDDRTIVLWDTSNQQKIRTLAGHIGAVTCIAFSLDGRWLASGSMDRTIRLWEVSTGRMIHTLNDSKVVSSVALSPDGHWLASTGDESVKIWDTTRPRVVHVMAHDDFVDALAFNPDGKLLASGSIDKTVRVWQVQTGRLLGGSLRHDDEVTTLVFSPDGQLLASAGFDKTIKFWQAGTWVAVQTLWQGSPVGDLAFNHGGTRLISLSDDGRVKFWDAPTWRGQLPCPRVQRLVNMGFR